MKTITRKEAIKRLGEFHRYAQVSNVFYDIFKDYEALQAENEALKEELYEKTEQVKSLENLLNKSNSLTLKTVGDLRAKLSEYKNRSCEGCKHYSSMFHQGFIESGCLELNMEVDFDFCCNKYEPKE